MFASCAGRAANPTIVISIRHVTGSFRIDVTPCQALRSPHRSSRLFLFRQIDDNYCSENLSYSLNLSDTARAQGTLGSARPRQDELTSERDGGSREETGLDRSGCGGCCGDGGMVD